MPARTLPNLGLKGFYNVGENGWGAEMSASLLKLSVLVQGGIKSRLAAVPGAPVDGDVHVLTAAPHAQAVAVYDAGAWIYWMPNEGWWLYDRAVDKYIKFDGAAWVEFAAGGGGGADYPDFDGNAGKVLAVNEDEDGVEWVEGGSGGGGGSGKGLGIVAAIAFVAPSTVPTWAKGLTVTRQGVGLYRFIFDTPQPDANYNIHCSARENPGVSSSEVRYRAAGDKTAEHFDIEFDNASEAYGAPREPGEVMVSVVSKNAAIGGGGGGGGAPPGLFEQVMAARATGLKANWTAGDKLDKLVTYGDFNALILDAYVPAATGEGNPIISVNAKVTVPAGKIALLLYRALNDHSADGSGYYHHYVHNNTTNTSFNPLASAMSRHGFVVPDSANDVTHYPVKVGVAGDEICLYVSSSGDGNSRIVTGFAVVAFADAATGEISLPSGGGGGGGSGGGSLGPIGKRIPAGGNWGGYTGNDGAVIPGSGFNFTIPEAGLFEIRYFIHYQNSHRVRGNIFLDNARLYNGGTDFDFFSRTDGDNQGWYVLNMQSMAVLAAGAHTLTARYNAMDSTAGGGTSPHSFVIVTPVAADYVFDEADHGLHQHWRLKTMRKADNGYPVLIGDLYFYDNNNNALDYGITSVSSTWINDPSKVQDNDGGSIWAPGQGDADATLTVNFGVPKQPRKIGIRIAGDGGWPDQAPHSFLLQYSDDGVAWTDATPMVFPAYAYNVENKVNVPH